jgi:hypothetical protein
MDIVNYHPINRNLKPWFDNFVSTYLQNHYLETVKTITLDTEVKERAMFFYVRAMNTVTSINTLFNVGDIVSARVLMRGLFEIKILIKKLKADKEEFIRYSKAYHNFKIIDSLKFANQNLDEGDSVYSKIFDKEENEKKLEELKNEIASLGFTATWNHNTGRPKVDKYFEIKDIAESVGLDYLYKSSYKNLCLDTHTSPGHIYKYMFEDDDGNKILNLHPYLHELDLMITITVGFLMDFFEDIEELLGVPTEGNETYAIYKKMFALCYSQIPDRVNEGVLKKKIMDM